MWGIFKKIFSFGKNVIHKIGSGIGNVVKKVAHVFTPNTIRKITGIASGIGNIAGTGLSFMGMPEFGMPLSAASSGLGMIGKAI